MDCSACCCAPTCTCRNERMPSVKALYIKCHAGKLQNFREFECRTDELENLRELANHQCLLRGVWTDSQNCLVSLTSETKVHLRTIVQDEHESTANATDDVCNESLEQTLGQTFLSCDLFETVHCALIKVLLHRLFGLHLQSTT